MSQKIIPNLWFHTDGGLILPLITYYQAIFQDNLQVGPIISLGETPGGYTELCTLTLFGSTYVFMTTALPHHQLNDAVSWILNCANQEEIDFYWNYFIDMGKALQCGWCQDRYGLRWQIVPENLNELLLLPHAHNIMMQQQKIVIAEYYTQK